MSKETFKPKQLVYPSLTALLIIAWLVFNLSDSVMDTQDYATDSLILLCLFAMWVTQPRHLRHRDVANYLVIVVCLKVSYFNDLEPALNRPGDVDLLGLVHWFQ